MLNQLLLAAPAGGSEFEFPWWVLLPVLLAVIAFSLFLLVVNRYKRCRSDQVLVIFGKVGGGNTSRCIRGPRLAPLARLLRAVGPVSISSVALRSIFRPVSPFER
jgi:uncharacterized membrane protein YqiK